MTFTAERDAEFNDNFVDVSKTEKRLLRATVSTYEKTGTYVFLKLFKRSANEEYECTQRLTMHIDELDALLEKITEIKQTA